MSLDGAPIPIFKSIAEAGPRSAWLCDVWGVLHDGATAFNDAIDACLDFRGRGGKIVLISNSPRPFESVLEHLHGMGVPDACFDALVTSGDVTRALVQQRLDQPMFHLGPQRDVGFFEGLPANFVPAREARIVVCTGLFDEDNETPADYDGLLSEFAARGVTMICANPDLVVERGNKLLPCAGALAERYAALGQPVIQAGKPYRPIYEAALQVLGDPIDLSGILAIGDGIETDMKGAATLGIDAVYIVSRVHVRQADHRGGIDPELLRRLFAGRTFRPVGIMDGLAR